MLRLNPCLKCKSEVRLDGHGYDSYIKCKCGNMVIAYNNDTGKEVIDRWNIVNPQEEKGDCEHKYTLLETKKNRSWSNVHYYYERKDIFFCEKCLEYVTRKKSGYSKTQPDWY